MIPIFKPSVTEREINAVEQTLRSGWWGSGQKVKDFEIAFSKFIGVKHGCALNSCTAALHLAGKLLDLKAGDEVITTPITFISTAYVALHNNAKVVFADVEPDTMNINPDDIRKRITDKTKAIVPVHFGGHACRMDEIMEIAKENNIYVVEDCAHASGGTYKGEKLGSFGDFSCFSFHAVKNLAIGDGGMLLSNDEERIKRAKRLRWVGVTKDTAERLSDERFNWKYSIDELGYKYQMNDILASIGLVQLQRLEEMNVRRNGIVKRYDEAFADVDWIECPSEKDYAKSARHNYVIKVDADRDKLIKYLQGKGISSSVHYPPLYYYKILQSVEHDCPVADRIWKRILNLPIFPDMTDEEIETVIEAVKGFRN